MAAPTTGTGRVCATWPMKAPRSTTSSTSVSFSTCVAWRAKVFQRKLGSSPSTTTRSRSSVGSGRAKNFVVGHVRRLVPPSSMLTVGRRTWKSKNSSGSMTANGSATRACARKYSAAPDAASHASFQPSNATTARGRRKTGLEKRWIDSTVPGYRLPRASLRRRAGGPRCRGARRGSPHRRGRARSNRAATSRA